MVESEEGNLFNANLMTGYFLYNKAKRRRSTLYITKEIFKKKHIIKQFKTIKRNSRLLSFNEFEHFLYQTNRL